MASQQEETREKEEREVVVVDVDDLAKRGRHAVQDALEKKRRENPEFPPKMPERVVSEDLYDDLRDVDYEVDLSALCAMEVIKLLRSREVTPFRLVESWAYRRNVVDLAQIKSTPVHYFDQAKDYARRKEASWEDEHDAHLLGMPVLMKGCTALRGFRRFDGFYALEDGPEPETTSWIVLQVQQAGGIIVGSTNIPEFAAGGHCFNEVYDTTCNPYDLRRSAGGSSGGSAAALASRQCWLALGTDLGGSLRTPAAFCGVIGFRVTPGTVPRGDPPKGVLKVDTSEDRTGHEVNEELRKLITFCRRYDLHSVEGPMARTIFDIGVLMDALTFPAFGGGVIPGGWEGLYPDELWSRPYPPKLQQGLESWRGIAERGFYTRRRCRVAISRLGCEDMVREDVFALIYEAARQIADDDFGYVKEPWPLDVAERVFYTLRARAFRESFSEENFPPSRRKDLKPEIQWNIASADDLTEEDFEKAFHDNEHVIAPAVLKLFEDVDVLCAPATVDLPFAKELRYPTKRYGTLTRCGEELAGGGPAKGYRDYMHWLKPAYVVSVTECPALVMPCGTLEDGLPVGIQLIAKPGDDALLVEVAASLEAALDLDFRHGIETPRTGSFPLTAVGPLTAEEARKHHDLRPPLGREDEYVGCGDTGVVDDDDDDDG
mmetsp:Transcript_27549/g.84484  ORF Transcript_27549/g.84484 Transcript_27549/m.84484 type:complete len:660 (+) Transcript_27549:38-2017(+)